MENYGNLPANDLVNVDFGDKRLNNRLLKVVGSLTKNAKQSILGAAGDRNDAKGAYRLLGNDKFDKEKIATAVRDSTINRMEGTVLLLEDTSDVNLNGHEKTEGLGYSSEHIRGVRLHSCIAVTTEGLPIGLVSQYYDTRSEAKSTLTRKEKAERTIEEKESYRWLKMLDESTQYIPDNIHIITICDREGDFYELYAHAQKLNEDFVIRVTHDRVTEADDKVLRQIRRTKASGQVTVNIPRNSRTNVPARQAEMEIAFCSINIKKPSNLTDDNLPNSLTLNIVRITEINNEGKEPIEWILATSLPINSTKDAMTIVEYYVQRWKIERFHFVLKSGCGVEKIQQRTFEKIKPMLLIYSVIAMFIMTITYIGRVIPDIACDAFFSTEEWQILYRITHKTKIPPTVPYSMADAVKYLGQLGSYKRAPSDGPPGLKSIWSGLLKLFEFMDLFAGQDSG
jgi:hypothetical protein